MSKYTTEVRFICENEAGEIESKGFNYVDEIIKKSASKIFSFDFPIFDEKYRLPLECKILRHYYTREICEESVGLWKLRIENKMNEIMPYYNQLYKSELLEFNPLYDVDYEREYEREDKGETQVDNESDIKNWNVFSDTPQGALTNVENETYLTNATKNTNESEGSSTSTIDNTEKYIEHIKGKQNGTSYSKMLNEFRKTFLNIDMEIINELSDLFFGLW